MRRSHSFACCADHGPTGAVEQKNDVDFNN